MMTFDEYQNKTFETLKIPHEFNKENNIHMQNLVARLTLGVCGEAGELAENVKKYMRDNDGEVTDAFLLNVRNESGDVLWYLSALCLILGIGLEDVAVSNVKKLNDRLARDKISGSGDNR